MMFQIQRHIIGDSALDHEVVRLIHDVFVGEGYTPLHAAAAFDGPLLRARGALWIATASDAVAGTIFLVEPTSPFRQAALEGEGEIHLLAVSSTHRGSGVGLALMEALTAEAKQRGMVRLVLSTQPSMVAAHALYVKVGFRRAPQRDRNVRDGRMYWVFEKNLLC
jgi:ribosomal protein S18 acetylase RimI-like enzyme